MYQTIVLGLGLLLVIGGGYLIKNMDREGVLASAFTQTQTIATTTDASASSTSAVDIEGTYLCSTDSGCPNPSLLTVTNDGGVSMDTTYDDGVETVRESGIWKSERRGGVNIILTGTDTGEYPSAHILSVKYVSPFSFSGITFNQNFYKDWTRPVFRKQDKGGL